jgi:hypothetical protein
MFTHGFSRGRFLIASSGDDCPSLRRRPIKGVNLATSSVVTRQGGFQQEFFSSQKPPKNEKFAFPAKISGWNFCDFLPGIN